MVHGHALDFVIVVLLVLVSVRRTDFLRMRVIVRAFRHDVVLAGPRHCEVKPLVLLGNQMGRVVLSVFILAANMVTFMDGFMTDGQRLVLVRPCCFKVHRGMVKGSSLRGVMMDFSRMGHRNVG